MPQVWLAHSQRVTCSQILPAQLRLPSQTHGKNPGKLLKPSAASLNLLRYWTRALALRRQEEDDAGRLVRYLMTLQNPAALPFRLYMLFLVPLRMS